MRALREIIFWTFVCAGLWGVSYGVEKYSGLSDPVKVLYFWSGWLSFVFLSVGLFAKKWGRTLGLFAFAFATMHLSVFVYFDFYFAWDLMFAELMQKHYLYYGVSSFGLMLILAGFSFWGKFYRSLVWLVLVSVILGLIHLVMIQKVLDAFYLAVIVAVVGLVGYKTYGLIGRMGKS